MISAVIGALFLAICLGAAVVWLVARLIVLIARIGLALLLGVGFGCLAGGLASLYEVDPVSTGVGAGLLAAILFVIRSPLERFSPSASVQSGWRGAKASRSAAVPSTRTHTLVDPALAARYAAVARDFKEALKADPLNMELLEWDKVLARVPELRAETEALERTASADERSLLRAQLADDLSGIVAEAERRVATFRRHRHAVLRRWVAIRTGRA